MRVVQFSGRDQARRVGVVTEQGNALQVVRGAQRLYDLARDAIGTATSLQEVISQRLSDDQEDYAAAIAEKRVLVPFDHPDPYHHLVTGTGLSHLGSAAARDAMHSKLQAEEAELTDSMKMFKWGVDGGKPAEGQIGVAPEWFYKGDGSCVVAPEQALDLPAYAFDGGDEVEVVGLYLVGDNGRIYRVGFALGNEYSDHVLERRNYLYLAHSKLRQCSYGPELLLGELPAHVTGHARLRRCKNIIWEQDWLSGEDNMCHSIGNLEHHHFKYREFRRPGDVHVHFFGAATGSFTSNTETQPGDVFEIESATFGKPLRNTLGEKGKTEQLVGVQVL
ncbi:MAG: FAH family protein [Betaproteobacteria bacterium]|nr:MAG: FAH family protein [Betaproteobacteria bacterium]